MSLWSRFINFLYNQDRSVASLFGAPPQETISSEVGRHAKDDVAAKALADALNVVDPGHTKDAIAHADALDKVDDGVEK